MRRALLTAWRRRQPTRRHYYSTNGGRTTRQYDSVLVVTGAATIFVASYCPTDNDNNTVLCDARSLVSLRRFQTLQKLDQTKSDRQLQDVYDVNWQQPLGAGAFGKVYPGKHRLDGTSVAIKEISKKFTNSQTFQAEINTLFKLRRHNGHPNICGLLENYIESDFFYLVLDLVSGPELFEHLIANGSYSEYDAARLIREAASALAFLHGLNIVHGDLKPENLMLSSKNPDEAVIKLVDFGTAISLDDDKEETDPRRHHTVNTIAYAPPELLKGSRTYSVDFSYDMWSLGVILYILLTGIHPFDPTGNSSDAELKQKIVHGRMHPLRKSAVTAHLSEDALSVIEQLLNYNPGKRLTASELLEHPWVRGETASRQKMVGSDERLSQFESKIFGDLVSLGSRRNSMDKRLSLIQAAFLNLSKDAGIPLSLTGFNALISENMKSRYFPRGHIIYREGERGDHMFFLNSGSVEVYTNDGSLRVQLDAGEFFGEGALVHPEKIRSASIRCLTPVHTIEVPRLTFEKYMQTNEDAKLNILEIDNLRRKNRARRLVALQKAMEVLELKKGDYVFHKGDKGREVFIVEEGNIDTFFRGHLVFTAQPGEIFGLHGLIFNRPRNVSARCASQTCRLHSMSAEAFSALLEANPATRDSFRDICLRREFQKAVCAMTRRSFPKNERELRRAFDAVDKNKSGVLDLQNIRNAIEVFDPTLSENDIVDMLESLDIDESGGVSWAEFKRIFEMNTKV